MRLDEVEMKRQSLFGDSRLSATWMLLSSTDRWPQRPALLNPGAVEKGGAGAYVEYLCHSAVGLKQNQLSAYSCFLQYPPLFCRYPLCRNHYALIYCSSVASRLLWLSFGFLSSSADPLIPLFSLHPIFSLSLSLAVWMQSSLCELLITIFLSSQHPPPLMLQCLLNQAGAWPQTASPVGLLGKSKLGLFKTERGHWFKTRLYKYLCVWIFGLGIDSLG